MKVNKVFNPAITPIILPRVTLSGKLEKWPTTTCHRFKGNSAGSDSGLVVGSDVFFAAVATAIWAQPKDFKAIMKEWVAIQIQAAFHGFLARGALRALKGVVRL